jgi:hypothetical protein
MRAWATREDSRRKMMVFMTRDRKWMEGRRELRVSSVFRAAEVDANVFLSQS